MEIRCKLPWMATREECAPYLRNRRAAPSQDMSVGFGMRKKFQNFKKPFNPFLSAIIKPVNLNL